MKKIRENYEKNNIKSISEHGMKMIVRIGVILAIAGLLFLTLSYATSEINLIEVPTQSNPTQSNPILPLSNYSLTNTYSMSASTVDNIIQITLTPDPQYQYINVSVQVLYSGVAINSIQGKGIITFELPTAIGSYTIAIYIKGNTMIYMAGLSGGLSSSTGSSASYATILSNAGVIAGLLIGMFIISFTQGILLIRRLTKEGDTVGEGIFKGEMENSEIHKHKQRLQENPPSVDLVYQWMKEKKYLPSTVETDKGVKNEKK